MKTLCNVLSEWEGAQRAESEALRKLAEAAVAVAEREEVITALLRKHGPVVHDGYVYGLYHGQIARIPCVNSLVINLEGK